MGFVIATFTATAIYGGIENMYRETVDSLKMIDPITYLGFVKRNNIRINIEKDEPITNKVEYELNKFDQLLDKMDYALMFNKKMLIYFPTVALLERFWEYCLVKNLDKYISKYHGRLTPYEKEESYRRFRNGETPVILATKAFGMGIDIDDIEIVAHFAPTGNVCDYVQEIGRAARRSGLIGEAYYHFMRNDFKHINRLHGLSVIKEYQLIEVIKKVYKLYQEKIKDSKGKIFTKKRNEMLVDAESFAHIFENPFYNEDDSINKVKTAMLLIQKDFEQRFGFSPFHIRPIPLFEIGYFEIDPNTQESITKKYGKVLEELDSYYHICEINLKKIWEKDFCDKYSFPRFKFLLYSKDEELLFDYKNIIKPALKIDITFYNNWLEDYKQYLKVLREIVSTSVREEKYYSVDGKDGLVEELVQRLNVSEYKAKSIIETIISAMSIYQHDYTNNIHGRVFNERILNSGNYKYKFSNEVFEFFKWFDRQVDYIRQNTKNGILYLVEGRDKDFKEKMVALGILEVFGVLVFKSLGGRNSQIYIYVNQTKTMREILLKPTMYKNRLLELIRNRHKLSVEMLSYIFENNLSNEEIWGIIEDYFLGIIPEQVKERYENDIVKAR